MLFYYLSMLDTPEEQSKLEKVYYEHRQRMKDKALKILKSESLAEDAVHEAFLRIIANLNKIEEIDSHKTANFVVTIVMNTSRDILKKENKHLHADVNEIEPFHRVKGEVFHSVGEQEVIELIKQLDEIHREVLMLKAFDKCSDKQIAKILGISDAAVRKRIERARSALSKLLNGG